MKSSGTAVSSLQGSRPEPKRSSAMRKPIFLSAPSCAAAAFMYCSAMLSVIWKQMRSGSCVPIGELGLEPLGEAVVEHAVARQAHEQAARLRLRGERQRRAHHPAIDVLEQVVALGRGHELRGQHFLALVIEHAHQHVEHVRILALQARHRLLHQAEAVLHERGLDVLDPDLVVGLHARVGVGLVEMEDLVAALAARAARTASITSATMASMLEPAGGTVVRPMVQLECSVFCPTVEVLSLKRASTASAQASTSCVLPRSSSARNETPANRPAMSLGPRCDLSVAAYSRQQLLAGAHAHVLLELGELVGPHQRHEAHAAGRRRGDAHADGVEQRPAQQQAGGGVALHRVGQIAS